jgi:hypothetical protein
VLRNAAVPGPVIERLLADANRRYYLHPGRLLALLRHIGTLHEFAGYVRGGLSLARQVVTWSR